MAGYTYPDTPQKSYKENWHGTVIEDPFQWLEDSRNPEVRHWIAAQNGYTQHYLEETGLQQPLRERFDQLLRYRDVGFPITTAKSKRRFFLQKDADKEKAIWYIQEDEVSTARVLLDPNTWDANDQIAYIAPSPNGHYLAYGVAHGGDENPSIHIMDIDTGRERKAKLKGWRQYTQKQAWLPDSSGFYYTSMPTKGEVPQGEEFYWRRVYLHRLLDQHAEADELVFSHETKKEYSHTVTVSSNDNYEILTRSLFYKNEIFLRNRQTDTILPLCPGDAEYQAHVYGDHIYILTNKDAPHRMVYITNTGKPEQEHWRVCVPESEDILQYIQGIGGYIFAVYSHNAHTRIVIYHPDGRLKQELPMPALGTATVSGNWYKPDAWLSFQSLHQPVTRYRYDTATDTAEVYFRPELAFDHEKYLTEQRWFTSRDGTQVSMFIARAKNMAKGTHPVLLTGYGGFNIAMTPFFSAFHALLLEAGFIIALPSLRGGSEYGEDWHQAGMKDKKQNVFDDFISAARWLIDQGYTRPEQLAISGGSNGGLLVGAALVQAPELFRAVVCNVPLLDMVRYHKFGIANIWAEEYGTAEDAQSFDYIFRYSPYHNTDPTQCYPSVMFNGSANDARTDPLHARKMAARLQTINRSSGPVMYLERLAAGHTGGATTSTAVEHLARETAFILHQLSVPYSAGK